MSVILPYTHCLFHRPISILDPLSLRYSSSCSLSHCWGDRLQKTEAPSFKRNPDETWQDCSWSKYAMIDRVGYLIWNKSYKMAAMTSLRPSPACCCICTSICQLPSSLSSECNISSWCRVHSYLLELRHVRRLIHTKLWKLSTLHARCHCCCLTTASKHSRMCVDKNTKGKKIWETCGEGFLQNKTKWRFRKSAWGNIEMNASLVATLAKNTWKITLWSDMTSR